MPDQTKRHVRKGTRAAFEKRFGVRLTRTGFENREQLLCCSDDAARRLLLTSFGRRKRRYPDKEN